MADASRGGRRRAALLPGARSPAELMARLAAEMAEAGESPEADADAISAAGGSDPGLADAPSSNAAGGVDSEAAAAAGPPAAGHSPAAAQPPATAAQQQPSSSAAASAPAYTSLARQQLHTRLKAAIAAGTGSPAPADAGAAHRPARQPPVQQRQRQAQGGPPAASSSSSRGVPWSPPLPNSSIVNELLLPSLGMQSSSSSVAGASALGAVDAPEQLLLPPPPTGLDESSGFQLPLPGRSLRQQAANRQPAGLGGASHSLPSPSPATGSSAPAPHRLAVELLGQQLYHPLPAGGGAACTPQQQQQQGVQRGLLSLAMPPLTERFFGECEGLAGAWQGCLFAVHAACGLNGSTFVASCRHADMMPVRARDAAGQPCLLVLPSDGPSGRQEAAAAEAALQELLADPAGAAHRAATWRQQLLVGSSSAALLGLTADYTPTQHQHQLRQPSDARADHALLAGPSWLARGGRRCSSRSSSSSRRDDVTAVRSSSNFLHSGSSCSVARSASPLPPLPRPASRLAAGDSGAQRRAPSACSSCTGSLLQLPPLSLAAAVPPAQHTPLPPAGAADPTWDAYCQASLGAGLAVCAAEAVRQVEVSCAERGRLLARLWNAYTGALAATLRQQAEQVMQLSTANANLSAGALRVGVGGMHAGLLGVRGAQSAPRCHCSTLRLQRSRSCAGKPAAWTSCAKRLAACARCAGGAAPHSAAGRVCASCQGVRFS